MPAKKKIAANEIRVTAKKNVRKRAKKTPASKSVVQKKVAVTKPTLVVKRGLHLWMHLTIAGSAVAVLLLLGVIDRTTFATLGGRAAESMPSTIGIEHQGPIGLSVLVARKIGGSYISVTNRSGELIHISVPSSWKRIEVTGAPLSSVTQDIPVFGFTRWTLPANAGIKLLSEEIPTALFFDSTSNQTTEVTLQTVNLDDESSTTRVVLLQKQALARLWGSDE